MKPNNRQWLLGRSPDLLVFFTPVWLTWLVFFLLPSTLLHTELPFWAWLVFILVLDVSHVWSTIYRTYLDRQERQAHRRLLLVAPALAFVVLVVVNWFFGYYFWRLMAYFALFHFIKQQYGFMMIYCAKQRHRLRRYLSDKFIIYLSMLYPVFYWHVASPRAFYWFQQGDFFNGFNQLTWLVPHGAISTFWLVLHVGYGLVLLAWLAQEVYVHHQAQLDFPWGKVLWLLTTAGNWFLGIVYFNSDLVFSVTNVVAHGVPYMALVFFYVEKKRMLKQQAASWNRKKVAANIVLMLLGILLLAYAEEYFWDGLVYHDKPVAFGLWFDFPFAAPNTSVGLALVISVLSLPQVTHYILDGFIWKSNDRNPYLKPILLGAKPRPQQAK